MVEKWSTEKELCEMSRKSSLPEALFSLKLIKNISDNFEIKNTGNWIRGGAETYIYPFSIVSNSDYKEYIFKACVAFSPGGNLVKILENWISRRKTLASFGVSTPKLIVYGGGVILEEFIKYPLRKILQKHHSIEKILLQLAFFAGVLEVNGFLPLSPFSDLRSRGEDVVMIDFGEDLGRIRAKQGFTSNLFNLLKNMLKNWDIKLDNELLFKMKDVYFSVENNTNNTTH